MRAQEAVGQGLVLAQQSQQQVLGLNIRRPKLAGLIPREKDDAPGFLRVPFEHKPFPLSFRKERGSTQMAPILCCGLSSPHSVYYAVRKPGTQYPDGATSCGLPRFPETVPAIHG